MITTVAGEATWEPDLQKTLQLQSTKAEKIVLAVKLEIVGWTIDGHGGSFSCRIRIGRSKNVTYPFMLLFGSSVAVAS